MSGHKRWTKDSPERKSQLVKRTRRARGTGTVREATHLSEDQFLTRHMYCINAGDIERERRDAFMSGTYFPKDPKAVCNHEEDGLCGRSITEEQLKEVNARLSGKSQETPEKTPYERVLDATFPGEKGKQKLAKMVAKITKEAEKLLPKKYWCLKCEQWHTEGSNDYRNDMEFRRKRGRPVGWKKK